ncbi:alpha-L-arabinofuranosidase, partial [Colletotrichum sojae]
LDAWSSINHVTLSLQNGTDSLSLALHNYVRVSAAAIDNTKDTTRIGIANSGWWGLDVQVQPYMGSFFVKGDYNGAFNVALQSSATNETLSSIDIPSRSVNGGWTKHEFSLTPSKAATTINNMLEIDASNATKYLDFNLISLFPPTYNNRTNGFRVELMEAIAELKPKFLRLPGGGNVNGILKGTQHKWNETIEPLETRPGRTAVWGYYETQVLVVWSGLNHVDGPISAEELTCYVHDAIDQIEFITGAAGTTFGALRASLGYPNPWKLKYVQIGNEENLTGGLESYEEYRLEMFYAAIKAKYPDLTIMASTSGFTSNLMRPDVAGDQHKYTIPDRFVGEYFGFFDHIKQQTIVSEVVLVAPNSDTLPSNRADYVKYMYPFWLGSVGEAVFALGAERNGDRVIGMSYAPLLTNMDGAQWTPTILVSARTARSTSFQVYKLLASHALTEVLPSTADAGFGPLYWVSGRDNATDAFVFKAAVYNSTAAIPMEVLFDGVGEGAVAELTILTSALIT